MNTSNKFLCIHGHFYQPPRENAWLEVIEMQDSAAPFHDWNERINFECYAPNTAARILDESNYIRKIVNNYARINFNFGPTLLSWMEKADPSTYQAILDADKVSQAKFNGHGSAIAQVHSHLILPLANLRDKETQIIWGIRDFEHRFDRLPEGMWLSETAVDTETLEVLAANGIRYTILAPRQARAVRRLGESEWHPVNAESVETRRPYLCKLPSGRQIVLFFYHGPLAQGIAFDGLLNNGKVFAERLVRAFDDNAEPQLVHVATDGESYGHHHRHGEMALAACLHYIEEERLGTITNYGYYLEKFPPTYEAQIHEQSSWSCAHGVERWRSNCGCHTGGHPGWDQSWRGPLRDTLNWLRDELIPLFEREASVLLKDPWKARNEYIDVLLNGRREEVVEEFLQRHVRKKKLLPADKPQIIRLMEMQRQAMQMFTSCGWFFDEVSGIETLQIMQYANRAIHYAKQVGQVDLHDKFVKRLAKVPSNVDENAAESYSKRVDPSRVDLDRVGMHYAVSSLFASDPKRIEFLNYRAESEVFHRETAGNQLLTLGRTIVQSKITYSKKHFSFAVLYLVQQNIIGNISIDMDPQTFQEMCRSMIDAFQRTNLGEVIGLMQQYFGPEKYTLWHLFRDEKRRVLRQITWQSLEQAEIAFRNIYNANYQLMVGMQQSGIPVPQVFLDAVEFVVNKDLHYFFENGSLHDVQELERLIGELEKWSVKLTNAKSFKLAVSERLYAELSTLEQSSLDLENMQNLIAILETLFNAGVHLDIWKSQNLYFSMVKGYKNGEWVFASPEWEAAFRRLGDLLKIHM